MADKFLKDSDFDRARAEVAKAQKLDPTNPYAYAFLDRITYFQEQKEGPKRAEEEAKKKVEEEAQRKAAEEEQKKAKEEAARKKEDEERKKAEESKSKEEEAKKKEEEAKRKEEEAKKKQEEAARQKEIERQKAAKAEEEKEKAEERRREESAKKVEEVRRKIEEKKQAEAKKKAEEEEAKKRAAEEAKKAEEEKKRAQEEAKRKAEAEAKRKAEEAKAQEEARKRAAEEARKAEEAKKKAEEARKAEEAKKKIEEAMKKSPVKDTLIDATRPVIADVLAARGSTGNSPADIGQVLEELSQASHQTPNAPKADLDVKLDDMRRQIEMLTKALDQERKVREEMNQQQLKGAIKQLRAAMEKAWVNGVPKDPQLKELHEMAAALGIPEEVEQTLNREVKLDMYSRAVKEVVAKQKLVRNSSKTLEWLRKVYQVTLDEYLEYESKFLMDLVADQYKGTILLVSGDTKETEDLRLKLKSIGYAVVNAGSPENALEKIEKINPHYILCDLEFSAGSLSGVKFLHVLRANSKFNYIPFILMCEKSEATRFSSSELRPTEGYVEKPIDIDDLNTIMNEKLMAFREYLSSL